LERLTFEDGTDMLPRNVGQQLSSYAWYVPRGQRPVTSHIYRMFVLRNFSLASRKLDALSAQVSVRPLQVHEQETRAETLRCSLTLPQLLDRCCDW